MDLAIKGVAGEKKQQQEKQDKLFHGERLKRLQVTDTQRSDNPQPSGKVSLFQDDL
jgi:hypothetical protein